MTTPSFQEPSGGSSRTFVLIPGSWCGAWCWKPVAERLRRAGHDVHPLSLTGLAERSHLLSDRITLETHVMDVINLIRHNDMRDVVLVGHSYAGVILTVVADRIPQFLRHIVYLDAMVPLPGECAMDMIPRHDAAQRIYRAHHDGGVSVPVPAPGHFASDAMRSASAFLVTTYVGSTSPPCTFSTQLRRNAERVIFFSEQIASSAASSSSENRTWTVRSLFGFLAA